jgi:hypothetical protein
MAPEHRGRIEELYHAALERPAEERAAFVVERSIGDDELRREVEALLAEKNATVYGQRFLMNAIVQDVESTPVTVVLNWKGAR